MASAAERFKANVEYYMDFILGKTKEAYSLDIKYVNPSTVEMIKMALSGYDSKILIESFIQGSHERWISVANKDIDHFKAHAFDIFRPLKVENIDDHIKAFTKLLDSVRADGNRLFTPSDEDVQWKCFQTFVKISINYIHEGRGPKCINENGTRKPIYTKQFFNDVHYEKNGGELVRKLGMKPLSFPDN